MEQSAKIQHYVPRFLLRNFGNGKKDQLWVYDKTTRRSFKSNVKNVAAESRFYDFERAGAQRSLEPSLANLESRTKPVISKLIATDTLLAVPDEERLTLAAFVATLLTRTKTFREEWAEFPKKLANALQQKGEELPTEGHIAEVIPELSDNDVKEQTARFVASSPGYFGPHIASKFWLLLETSRKHPFMISDNPIAKQNLMHTNPHRSGLGLSSKGIEIYLPLSETRALGMFCPSLIEPIKSYGARLSSCVGDSAAQAILQAVRNGTPLQYRAENVENFNSLQVGYSERYLFSSNGDFSLVDSMLADEPALIVGPRSQIR
jgi:Protein of unknown function (DUF4238)